MKVFFIFLILKIEWKEYLPSEADIYHLCAKITDLSFFLDQLSKLSQIYHISADMEQSRSEILHAIHKISEYIAKKLCFIDLGSSIYCSLYTAPNITLAKGLYDKVEILKNVRRKIPQTELKIVLDALLKGLINGWLYYVSILLTTIRSEEIRDLPNLIEEDMQQLRDFFSDSGDKFKGLPTEQVSDVLKPMQKFIQFNKQDDNSLIGQYKNIASQDEASKELVTRILFGRNSKDVERFFDLYKSTLTK